MKTLGKVSAKLISRLYDENKPIFKVADIMRINQSNFNAAKKLVADLRKRKVIMRLKKGKYLIIPQELGTAKEYLGNWLVFGREVINTDKYYLGFYSAMNYWGLTTQPILKIFVVTTKRQMVPKEMRNNLIFIYISEKFYWGIREIDIKGQGKVKISDLEKTILDGLVHPEYGGGITEIAKGIWLAKQKIDFEKLLSYIKKLRKNAPAKRLGYLLELLKIENHQLINELRKFVKDRYDRLDPLLANKSLARNSWRLKVNINPQAILNIIWH